MPWYNGDHPPSYKNQHKYLRDKAVEISNEVLKSTGNECEAIATGIKYMRQPLKTIRMKFHKMKKNNEESDCWKLSTAVYFVNITITLFGRTTR